MQNSIYQIAPTIDYSTFIYGTHLLCGRLTKEQIITVCEYVLAKYENNFELYKDYCKRFVVPKNYPPKQIEDFIKMHYNAVIVGAKLLIDDVKKDRLTPLNTDYYFDLPDIIKAELDYALLFNDGNPLAQTVEAMANFKELAKKPTYYDYI